MKINYKIEEVWPRIFAVMIADDYDRAMTFCRVQEYYESPEENFRGKNFSIWQFMKWYSSENGSFSYAGDWAGFNVPLSVAVNCYKNLESETPYDLTMRTIINKIDLQMYEKKNKEDRNAYIIGVRNKKDSTFYHEVCHGLYATSKKYKQRVDKITSAIPAEQRETLRYNLLKMGYTEAVMDDEIQAYLSTNWNNARFSMNVDATALYKYHQKYQKVFEKF